MSRTLPNAEEFERERKMLLMPVGIRGSGNARYSAAMYFHKLGEFPAELLEIYRRCSKFDREDPVRLAQNEGVDTKAVFELEKIRRHD